MDDELAEVAPLLERCGDFATFLGASEDQQATRALRVAESTGRPLGSAAWIAALEASSGRTLAPRKRGPKSKAPAPAEAISCI